MTRINRYKLRQDIHKLQAEHKKCGAAADALTLLYSLTAHLRGRLHIKKRREWAGYHMASEERQELAKVGGFKIVQGSMEAQEKLVKEKLKEYEEEVNELILAKWG